jgi:hypothetical protein
VILKVNINFQVIFLLCYVIPRRLHPNRYCRYRSCFLPYHGFFVTYENNWYLNSAVKSNIIFHVNMKFNTLECHLKSSFINFIEFMLILCVNSVGFHFWNAKFPEPIWKFWSSKNPVNALQKVDLPIPDEP